MILIALLRSRAHIRSKDAQTEEGISDFLVHTFPRMASFTKRAEGRHEETPEPQAILPAEKQDLVKAIMKKVSLFSKYHLLNENSSQRYIISVFSLCASRLKLI